MTTLPPWSGDPDAMLQWLRLKLNAKFNEKLRESYAMAAWRKLTPHQQAMQMASEGHVELLRRYLVELTGDAGVARFVNLPKSKRGKQWKHARIMKRPLQPPEIAKEAVLIREIWNEHYGRKQRRHPDWAAEEFASTLFLAEHVEGFDPTKRETEWSDRVADQNRRGKK